MIGSAWMSSTSITLLAFWAGQANATRLSRLGLARGIQFQTLAKTGRGCSGVFCQCGPRNLHFEFHFFSRGERHSAEHADRYNVRFCDG
ncbi:hypothetical protein B0T09DRAFT_329899 [Sordaria sp. MPI-SDFR-AT-0083]|nr:hypothetical protein B0T09DRAFT_329899 [Sordaria sp. MPI-SDFR-AT-0083]